jgi:hypothetical protein
VSRFEYHADQVTGDVFLYVDYNQQWVEKISQTVPLFWCKHPQPDLWDQLYSAVVNNIVDNFSASSGKLGVVQQLAEERLTAPFTLPPMFSLTENGTVTYGTGISRLAAEVMCATPIENLHMIIACADIQRVHSNFHEVKKITTTDEFEEIYNLKNIDYSIIWEIHELAKVRFINSIVRHSIYEIYQETDKYFIGANSQRLQFLDSFTKNRDTGQIEVNVYCVKDQEKFFTHSDSVFRVNFFHQRPDEWTFSYGRLMGEFRHSTQGKSVVLNIWAFDIQQPVNLYILLMWASLTRTSYYTKNRKLTVFNPTNIASIKEIPDLVK